MKAAELFVKQLEAEEIAFIFGIPGEESLDLLDAIARSSTIRFILTRHEQAAGHRRAVAAHQDSHASRRNACFLSHLPGRCTGECLRIRFDVAPWLPGV